MGSCQSSSAVASNINPKKLPENEGTAINKHSQEGSSVSSTHLAPEDIGQTLEHPQKGYSPGSGGLSVNGNLRSGGATATGTSTSDASHSRPESTWHEKPGSSSGEESNRSSDRLRLGSMRNVMQANGDLTQTVVRLETPFGKPIEDIYDGVYDGPVLGQGVAGIVRKVQHRATGVEYACKELDLSSIDTEAGLRQLRNEISIMCQLDHPNIVRIEEVYEETNTIYLLQELCLGGELYDRLDQQDDLHYTEAICARLVKQIVSAVRYLHSKGVVHRDLKLENFLFSTISPDSELKMIDFGLSKHFEHGDVLVEQVGTRYTCAPEIFKGSYDFKCDIWAIGVLAYMLLCGDAPFGGCYEGECLADVKQNILCGSLPFEPADIWDDTSDLSKQFVRRLLNVDPTQRPTAKEVQGDEWLRKFGAKKVSCGTNRLNPRIVQALVNFKGYSEMRRLLHEVLSFTLLPEQIVELREEFQKIDTDNDGEITLEELKDVLINTAGGGALGGLTEAEVEDLFGALKVNKTDSTIRWHGFIAAGLSQCKVDNRNLQLAFDRLDADRDGYICFDDLTVLLGKSPETLESIKRMWKESMYQTCCQNGKLNYDDFLLLMKGQARRESYRPSMVWSPLCPMLRPEDQALLEELAEDSSSDSSKQEYQGGPETSGEAEAGKTSFGRKRSKSFDDIPSLDGTVSRRTTMPATPQTISGGSDLDKPTTPLLATREQYKKHCDIRMAIIEASKDFDTKRQAITPLQKPGLIMKRGKSAPQDLEDLHQRTLFDAAIRRGGRQPSDKQVRPGHRRKRTQSDITGLLNAGLQVSQ